MECHQGGHRTPQTGGDTPRTIDLREVWNALMYKVRTGCQWRLLPKEFPHYNTVNYSFRK
jgi:transposase